MDLLQKLEEKMMAVLVELEKLRKENSYLKQENQGLKEEYHGHAKKLQGLISLLDSLEAVDVLATQEKVSEYVGRL